MRIAGILRSKGCDVVTVAPDRTVLEVVRTLVRHDIGAVVVEEGGRLVGILSERDVLRLSARGPEYLAFTRVANVMTTDVLTACPTDGLRHVMDLMTENRVRHLPIIADGRLAGIVSIGDVVDRLRSDTEETNRHLRAYIAGVG